VEKTVFLNIILKRQGESFMCPYFNDKNIPKKCSLMDQNEWNHVMDISNFMYQVVYCLASEYAQMGDIAGGFANCEVYKCV